MAGAGSRFQKAGYTDIKPLIKINNKTLIRWAIETIDIDGDYIFIVQQKDFDLLKDHLKELKPDCVVLTVEKLTNGAVETCLRATDYLQDDEELIIVNNDQAFLWDSGKFLNYLKCTKNVDGVVLTFESESPDYSFIQVNDENEGILVKEKDVISNHALTGLHYYRKSKYFYEAAKFIINNNVREKNEYYISSTYQYLIDKRYIVTQYKIPTEGYIPLGTPKQIELHSSKLSQNIPLNIWHNNH